MNSGVWNHEAPQQRVERIARALAEYYGFDPDETWDECTRQVDETGALMSYPRVRWQDYEGAAQAIEAQAAEIDNAVKAEREAIVNWLLAEINTYPRSEYSGFCAMIAESIKGEEHLK